MKNVLAISASNSAESINRQLLTVAVKKITASAVNTVDIRDYPMPMYSSDLEGESGFPDTAKQLHDLFSQVDAFVISTPEHNGSMPAVFKNMIDWLSRMVSAESTLFSGKPVLLISTSPGPRGGATNLQTLTQIMPYWGGDIRGSYSLGSFYENFSDGCLIAGEDQKLSDLIDEFIGSL